MIEKIIDKYFAKKAIDLFRQICSIYIHDYKIEKDGRGYTYYVKKHKAKDVEFKRFITISYKDGLTMYMKFATERSEWIFNSLERITKDGDVKL